MQTPQEKLVEAIKLINSVMVGMEGGNIVAISAQIGQSKDNSHLLDSMGITKTDLSDIYDVQNDALDLKIKVYGSNDAEAQRKLGHILLIGYRLLLGVNEVLGSKIIKVCKSWDIDTDKLVRNLDKSPYIQVRNKGKGKDPLYSLKPGSLEKLGEEIKSLLGK